MAHMPIFSYLGIRFLAIFWPIGLQSFVGAQETIIYRLVMRNTSYDAYFQFFCFWATLGGKMGVAITRAPNDLGPQIQPKSWPTGWTFWANCYLENVFSKFSGLKSETPFNVMSRN